MCFADHVLLASIDDKTIVPVGEPGLPISTGVRGHNRSLVLSSCFLSVLDHDFHIHGVVPSVCLMVQIHSHLWISFFSGQVYVVNKNKVTQPSSALRHSAELSKIVLQECCATGSNKSVLVVMSDGGPDHRLSYGSVQVALLALFIHSKLDVLIAVCTCPYQSWSNTADRVLSLLNLALQNVSLERQAISEKCEKLVHNVKTVKELRSHIVTHPNLGEDIGQSLQPVIDLLNARFQQMKLKEHHFKAGDVASEEQIQSVFDEVHAIDPSISVSDLSQKSLKKAGALQEFLLKHSHITTYAVQFRKCLLDTCSYCSSHPVRMPIDEFSSLGFLPMPRLDSTWEHYQPFDEVYLPDERDRPSNHCSDEGKEIDKANRKMLSLSGKVRSVIMCRECLNLDVCILRQV